MELSEIEDITLCQKIGEGSFGLVRLGRLKLTNEEVAVKLEVESVRQPLLRKEYDILMSLQGCPGVPRVYSFGTAQGFHYMAMQLLGNSLSHKMRICGGKLSIPTVLRCASQMVDTLEAVHNAGFIHRDIKPQNFLVGLRPNSEKMFIIDFGLARRGLEVSFFRSTTSDSGHLTGTLPYVSIHVHLGLQAARRDDLESLGYVLTYLAKGSLPWHGDNTDSLKEKQVRTLKQGLDIGKLCEGLPSEFEAMLRYVRGLHSDDEPNYSFLRKAIGSAQLKLGPQMQFDWGEEKVRTTKRTKSHKSAPKFSRQSGKQRMSMRLLSMKTVDSPVSAQLEDEEGEVPKKEKTLEKVFQGFADKKSEILARLPSRDDHQQALYSEDVKIVVEDKKSLACFLF